MKDKKRQEIFVERGMADGQRIILAGAGDQQAHLFQLHALDDVY